MMTLHSTAAFSEPLIWVSPIGNVHLLKIRHGVKDEGVSFLHVRSIRADSTVQIGTPVLHYVAE